LARFPRSEGLIVGSVGAGAPMNWGSAGFLKTRPTVPATVLLPRKK
jgi:hypothetical protein